MGAKKSRVKKAFSQSGLVLHGNIVVGKAVIFLQGEFGFPTRFYGERGFKITSPFGPRPDPFNPGKTDFHTGIDYGGRPQGTLVQTTVGGTVFAAKMYGGWGNLVGITDSRGYNHLFAHLQAISVRPGQTVARGDAVGTLGSTGQATGPHLHYQINRPGAGVSGNGYFGDPDRYYFEEEVEEVERAIVLGSDADYCNAAPLRDRLNCPVFFRSALVQLAKVSTIYICGGPIESVREAAPNAKL
ncbi:MAG TPA: hypothetical protein DDY38_08135, partial [Firmicutes bacterium]|nr:hypothetical protein [Bacillota bacterium]